MNSQSKLDKLKKKLGEETATELEAASAEDLKKVIVQSHQAMDLVRTELEANPVYQDLKVRLGDVTQAKKDVDGRQKAKIAYCLLLLADKGE